MITVGALIAAGRGEMTRSKALGRVAMALVAVNTFGGFAVTQRTLAMYRKRKR